MQTWSAAVMLLLIMDPLGNLPIFVSILKNLEPDRRRSVLIRELLIALLILYIFLFSGQLILSLLSVRPETVSIAGGVVLFLIAIKMIFPQSSNPLGVPLTEEPFVVPLAIPLIAGPSILAALILLANQSPGRMLDWAIALGGAWVANATILLFSDAFHRKLGVRGLIAMERLMGMILVMISVQKLLDGVKQYLAGMTPPIAV
jgi:multiple antibiotic resistance protein